jgi:hypothetical protein
MRKTWILVISKAILLAGGGVLSAQEISLPPTQPENVSPSATSLQGTDAAKTNPNHNNNTNILGNGVQVNGGFSNSLPVPSCNRSLCTFLFLRSTPYGNEAVGGVVFQTGSTGEEWRLDAEKAKLEIERIKNERDFKIQIMEKLATAVEANQCIRAKVFAQELAPMYGFSNHLDYLKSVGAKTCIS